MNIIQSANEYLFNPIITDDFIIKMTQQTKFYLGTISSIEYLLYLFFNSC